MEEQHEIVFQVNHLKKYFPVYGGFFKKEIASVKALDDVSLSIRKGETLGIVGESGCGKTTLGKNLLMLEKPSDGEILYNDQGVLKDITKMNKEDLFQFRKQVQMVFQDPYSSLNPVKKIYNAFEEPLKAHGFHKREEREEIMKKMMEMVNLQPDYIYRYPHEFSGGQRQRICIARALCINPSVVICDEPVSALDVSIQAQVLNLMKEIQHKMNLSYVFIAHDLSVVEYMSDRIVVMYLGKVMEIATSDELSKRPLHPYTEALLSAVPIPKIGEKRKRIVLEGDVPSPIHKPSGCPFHNRCRKCMEICRNEEPVLKDVGNNHLVYCHLYDGKEAVNE
ncbi:MULTISPECIES: ABC transporter ATP-binding protein [Bacillota]|jgi:oligopeptide/dipeptide ABC transporter ATP-binding protein|uniref:Dipeptide ABC transporter ATP-binding protein n=1 Tax=Amedibacillus hominis TaxID=2897776 RepID=A0ABS9RBQ2_9FIRM|nr:MULTISPECIES: dipeptide ABC transporter ATP-binding protein [Bacillota]MCH4287087.1 dipeptide ABC transporter ATP-binding protein [Amedibacillus hominis]RGB49190.1 dipeptide ABC transporter ATP-binding protein [Absiella sp. AM22-9]RGB54909.1 dipeptide ABC transporter ATP-binding protein [Absiella sp. AM10-20]RGB63933.1 dipeptide ABC transporter ATP-binding protein [Absiella sp. AM09-45]RGB72460.1 dipeptide ABC transporter ATP-binding protein [Absiella sp. AM09-50]